MYIRRLLVFLGVLSAASLLFLAILPQKGRFMNAISNAVKYQDSPLLNSIHTSWVREYYARQASERITLLNDMSNPLSFASIYNVIVPEARCPDLVRVGRASDGGKYVCNPKAFPTGNCSIYSFGLNNEVSFDVEIQQMTGCQLYGYDSAEQTEETKTKYNSVGGKLGVAFISSVASHYDAEVTTIEQLFRRNGDDSAELLKVDIEGAEHSTIVPFITKYEVCQILLEIHGEPTMHLRLLNSIAKLGYVLFSYEVNGDSLKACEYSFVHVDCLRRYGLIELKRFLHEVVPSEPETY